MSSLPLPPEIAERLADMAKKIGQDEATVAYEAILTYLEDLEDGLISMERLRERGRRIPLEEVLRDFQKEEAG